MSQSAIGGRTLPDNGNVDIGSGSHDIAAIISALRELSDLVTTGSGAPSGTPTGPRIYLRIGGTTANALSINVGGTSVWNTIAASA